MRDSPRVSVLLPTHNGERTVGFAIRSVLAQTEHSLELLIVGDGCTDRTKQIAESFGDERVRFFELPKGPGFGYANRNTVLAHARGTYVAFMAHDDLWLPDHLARLLAALEAPGIALAYSRPCWVIPKGRIAPLTFNLHDPQTLDDFLSLRDNRLPASCFVYRRALQGDDDAWNATLPEQADWHLWIKLIRRAGVVGLAYLPEVTCLHFRASWRTDATAGPNTLEIWQQLHAQPSTLPAELTVHVPNGVLEQAATWDAIAADPSGWPVRLRRAVTVATDRRVHDFDDLTYAVWEHEPAARANPVVFLSSLVRFAVWRERVVGGRAWQLAQHIMRLRRFLP